jgi:predicted ArsR family transcriptional regulator
MSTEQEAKPRGRPRDPACEARDDAVYALLETGGPATRNELAEKMDLRTSLVYNALDRLRNAGRVRPCLEGGGVVRWAAGGDLPCR